MEICLLTENAYPTSKGGVSEWCHSLIKEMDDVQFKIFSVSAEGKLRYSLPRNVEEVVIELLQSPRLSTQTRDPSHITALVNELKLVLSGRTLNCEEILWLLRKHKCRAGELLGSNANWNAAVEYYEEAFPHKPFALFYSSWVALFYTLYITLESFSNVPGADAYHSLNAGYAGLLGCLTKLDTGTSLILTEHGLYLKERIFELNHSEIPEWLHGMYKEFFASLVRTSYKYSDIVTSVCQDHTYFQREVTPNINNKVRVIYNGIDTKRFHNNKSLEERRRGPFNIGTITRITPIKGVLTLIRAASRVLQKHEARFYIVGEVQDEEYFEECRRLIARSNLNPYIEFKGFQDSLKWYPQFDVFVLPSLSEGFPLTLLEALSFEVPCIATAVGGIPEILDKDYLVPKWDYEGLAERISWLLESSDRRREIGLKGRDLVQKRFNLSNMIREYKALYEAMM